MKVREARHAGWKARAARATAAGMAGAHAYIRQAQPTTPAAQTDGIYHALTKESAKWGAIWSPPNRAFDPPDLPSYVPAPLFDVMEPDTIRSAVKRFRPNTALGAEGFHPRAVGLLGDEALRIMAAFFLCSRKEGFGRGAPGS